MNTQLLHRFETLERDRIILLKDLSDWPATKLCYSADPRKWSVNQTLLHLLTSEQLTLRYLKKKSLAMDQLKHSGPTESLKMVLLVISQRLPFMKFKAPAILLEATPQYLDMPDLMNQWDELRFDLKDFLGRIGDQDVTRLVYKHPVAGRLNLIQCLLFMREHFHHHLQQINRCR